MIYHYPGEVKKICEFLGADEQAVTTWLKDNTKTDKYLEFQVISGLGQEVLQLTYGKNLQSKTKVVCQVSGFGTRFQEAS